MSETARIWSHNLALGLPAHGFSYEHRTVEETDSQSASHHPISERLQSVSTDFLAARHHPQTSRVDALRGRA